MEKEKRKPRYVLKETKTTEGKPPQARVDPPREAKPSLQQESRPQQQRRPPPPRLEETKKKSYIERRSSQQEELCMVCSERIKAAEAIWSCKQCFQFMHLACIKKWIFNLNKDNKKRARYNWTCPQCIFEYCEELPEYYCFCGKYRNPECESGVAAHSCGSYCERKRGFYCEHPCPDLCHSGRCRPCNEQGMEITCGCGRSKMKTRCSDEKQTFVCGKKCDKLLNCEKHKCNQNCHDGFCNPCSYKHLASCYCGKNDSVVDCVEVSYQCEDICGKTLDCGAHTCQERCHKGPCKTCSKKPDVLKTCPCGQYSITMLSDKPRELCTDPVPVCGMPCKKKLICGHSCSTSCHEGKCPPCKLEAVQKCKCESSSRKAECWQLYDNSTSFTCERICKRRKSCGQHYCSKECCQYRNSSNNLDHECLLVCQKQLNCNKHTCGMPCHFGNCGRCPVLYSQPQPCPCGRTFLRAPVVCGTIVPECENPCGKEMECGHVCYLTCHYGACKCDEKVIVGCQCGRNKIETTCGKQVLCTEKCEKQLPCGHICSRQCHSGSCFDPATFDGCTKNCSKVRAPCGHICNDRCHTKRECTDSPCRTEVSVKCECGNRVKLVECGSTTVRIERHIQCNKTCENLKRFQVLYKERSIYYPPGLVYFGMKNLSFLQKVEDAIYNFVRSGEHSLHIDFSRFSGVNNAKYHFNTLFEKHYFLDVTFYHNKKSTFFTLTTTKSTMIPQPSLSKYIAMLESGEIKKNTVPFTASIKFSQLPKEKLDLFEIVLAEFAHHYYSERRDKVQYFHFWLEEHANEAAKLLREKFPSIAIAIQLNNLKEDVDTIGAEEIVEELTTEQVKQEEPVPGASKEIEVLQVQQGSPDTSKLPNEKKLSSECKSAEETKEPEAPKPQPKKPEILLKSRKFPPSSEYTQSVYELDDDELYEDVKDWGEYVSKIATKQLGVEASEWRIRSLIIVRALFPLKDDPTKQLIHKLLTLYKDEQSKAKRFLSIRNIELKKTKELLAESEIVVSGNEPEMVSYHILLNPESNPNSSLTEELIQTSEVNTAHDILHSLETNNHQSYFKTLQQCDYLMACAILPFLDDMRMASIKELIGKLGGRMESLENFWNTLFFDSEDAFVDFLRHNRMKIISKESKKLGRECSYIVKIKQGEEESVVESVTGSTRLLRLSEKLLAKRDVRYAFGESPQELWKERYCLKSYFAFGDHKSTNYDYETMLLRSLRRK